MMVFKLKFAYVPMREPDPPTGRWPSVISSTGPGAHVTTSRPHRCSVYALSKPGFKALSFTVSELLHVWTKLS